MIEQGIGTFIVIVLVLIAIFVFSLFIPFYGFMRKRFKGLLLGCILQPVIFAIIAAITLLCAYFYYERNLVKHRENAMITLKQKSDDTPDPYISRWHIKPDGECFYEFGKEDKEKPGVLDIYDNDDIALYDVVPMDSFRVCVDDVITVQFDLKNRKVKALNYDVPLEVENVDWEKVEAYFNDKPSK
ncbi:MAG: hypothetical protein IJQ04_00015 [Prevotella sp.]|nr:hypothetical protein [Prevotella sp.]